MPSTLNAVTLRRKDEERKKKEHTETSGYGATL